MPDTPATAAFRDGAALLQDAGTRLAALSSGIDQRLAALIGRLDTLPPAADFDPFAAALFDLAATGANAAAEGTAARQRRGTPAQARPAAATTLGPPFAFGIDGRVIGNLARSVVAGIGTVVSPVLSPSLGAVVPGVLARAATQGASRRPAPAGRRPLAPASAEAAAAADAAAALVANLVRAAAPELVRATAPGQPGGAASLLPALSIIEDQLGAIAGATASAMAAAGATPVAGAATSVSAHPPAARAAISVPRSAAVRAPSRLLPGPGATAGESTRPAAAADSPVTAQGGSPEPAFSAGLSDDEVVAAINRLLVDQAWMRGVDLQ